MASGCCSRLVLLYQNQTKLNIGDRLTPAVAVTQVSRQLQALDRCFVSKSQAEAKSGKRVVAVTVLAVKVAQNATASALEAVYAAAQA